MYLYVIDTVSNEGGGMHIALQRAACLQRHAQLSGVTFFWAEMPG